MLLSASCHAYEGTTLSHVLSDSSSAVNGTSLDSAYLSLKVGDKQYYAGFTIDSDGVNSPTLIEIGKVVSKQKSWKFTDIISDLFIFDTHVSVALDSGEVFSLINDTWAQRLLLLTERPRIVYSDGGRHLIACSSSSPMKEGKRLGGCASYSPNWNISFPWYAVRPRVCGDLLFAVTWQKKQNQRIAVDIGSGKIVRQETYRGGDVCAQFSH
jgi:hypothetical protein